MAFQVDCFIRKNSKELRDKLEKLGHTICKCCEFDGADWLEVSCNAKMQYSVHGIGYTEKEGEIYGDITQEEVFKYFLKTTTSIDCGTNEDMFLAIAALRDDSDYMQWFVFPKTHIKRLPGCFGQVVGMDGHYQEIVGHEWHIYENKDNELTERLNTMIQMEIEDMEFLPHKATVEEIIEHFK